MHKKIEIRELIEKYFPVFWMAAGFLYAVRVQLLYGKALLDSDMAGEMILANLLNKEHGILSHNWFYSTEIRVFELQWFFRIGLLVFPHNWHMARVLADVILFAVLIAGVFFCLDGLKLKKYAPWVAGILMWPYGRLWLILGTIGNYYLVYILFSLYTIGLITHTPLFCVDPDRKKTIKSIIWIVLSFLIGMMSGLNGPKQTFVLFFPLFFALLFNFIFVAVEKGASSLKEAFVKCAKEIAWFVSFTFSFAGNIIGMLINRSILSVSYSGGDSVEKFGWSESVEHRITDILGDLFLSFGYEASDSVTNFEGIASLLGIFLGMAVFGSIVILLFMVKNLSSEDRLVFLLAAWGVIFCCIIFSRISGYQNYHWLTQHVFLFMALMVMVKNIPFKIRELSYGAWIVFAVGIMIISKNTLKHQLRQSAYAFIGYDKAAEYIMSRDVTCGYGTIWCSSVIRELTSDSVDMWTVLNWWDDFKLYGWLQEKYHFETEPEGKCCVVINTRYESDYIDPVIYGNYIECAQFDTIYVYIFESADDVMAAIEEGAVHRQNQ